MLTSVITAVLALPLVAAVPSPRAGHGVSARIAGRAIAEDAIVSRRDASIPADYFLHGLAGSFSGNEKLTTVTIIPVS